MQDISIGRFDSDPEAQGVIRPKDGRWQLVIDKDGYPHLYVQVNVNVGEKMIKGMFCIEDMLPPPLSIREIMDGGDFGEPLPPEEEEAAHQEYLANHESRGIPCPRDYKV